MRAILFIGHHKVGSSALQNYLALNAVDLLDQGILYPAVEDLGLQRLARGKSLLSRLVAKRAPDLHVNIREPHNARAFSMMSDITGRPIPAFHTNLPDTQKMLENIKDQIALYQPHTVILAAEVFSNFGNFETPPIEKLLSIFPKADLTITATLRRVDDHLISWRHSL